MFNKSLQLHPLYWGRTTNSDAAVNTKLLRLSSIALIVCAGASSVAGAQTVLELRSPASTQPCVFQTAAEAGGLDTGVSVDILTGRLKAFGNFVSGCSQGAPAPVIMPGPVHWVFPSSWIVGQAVNFQWAGNYADSCKYLGTDATQSATGWAPRGTIACGPGGTFPSCASLNTSVITPTVQGIHQFVLECTNSAGTVTSTSIAKAVNSPAVTPPTINAGPATWGSLLPWTVGQDKALTWTATGAESCEFTANQLPPLVGGLQDFVVGQTTCNNNSGSPCNGGKSVTLKGTVEGSYKLTLTCRNAGGEVTSTNANNWIVSPPAGGGESCPTVGTFNRVTNADVYFVNVSDNIGNVDVRNYEGIYGREYSQPGAPITKKWPGVSGILAAADFGNQQYLALKFDTNSLPTGAGSFLTIDATTWGQTGGGLSGSPTARISMTISKKCGDFDRASADIPASCFKSNMGGNQSFGAYVNSSVQGICSLAPNQTYYLNMIYAPLTTPATAVYNGRGQYVVQIRNFTD